MPPEDLEIRIVADDETQDEFRDLLRRIQRLERSATNFNREQSKAISDNARASRAESSRAIEQIRARSGQQRASFSRELQGGRDIGRSREREHRRQIARINTEDRLQIQRLRGQQQAEQDIRRARIRSEQEERTRRERIERDRSRVRQTELREQSRLNRITRRRQITGGSFLDIADRVSAGTVALGAFGVALAGVGTSIIRTAVEFERLSRGLAAISGNAITAENDLRRLREIAELPGIEFTPSVRTFSRLRAGGFQADTSIRLIQEFGNAAALAGGTIQDVSESLRQLQQIRATGRFTAENLNVILERLPPIRQAILAEFGTTVGGELQKVLERQGQSFDDAVRRILDRLQTQARAPSDTFANSVSNLNNALGDLQREIGGNLLPVLTQLVNGVATVARALGSPVGQIALAGIGSAAIGGIGGSLLRRLGDTALGGALFGGRLGRRRGSAGRQPQQERFGLDLGITDALLGGLLFRSDPEFLESIRRNRRFAEGLTERGGQPQRTIGYRRRFVNLLSADRLLSNQPALNANQIQELYSSRGQTHINRTEISRSARRSTFGGRFPYGASPVGVGSIFGGLLGSVGLGLALGNYLFVEPEARRVRDAPLGVTQEQFRNRGFLRNLRRSTSTRLGVPESLLPQEDSEFREFIRSRLSPEATRDFQERIFGSPQDTANLRELYTGLERLYGPRVRDALQNTSDGVQGITQRLQELRQNISLPLVSTGGNLLSDIQRQALQTQETLLLLRQQAINVQQSDRTRLRASRERTSEQIGNLRRLEGEVDDLRFLRRTQGLNVERLTLRGQPITQEEADIIQADRARIIERYEESGLPVPTTSRELTLEINAREKQIRAIRLSVKELVTETEQLTKLTAARKISSEAVVREVDTRLQAPQPVPSGDFTPDIADRGAIRARNAFVT